MGNIVLLDELTINQIAAGEVIERPASVIKEMVENAIDAGATKITVEIKNGGISFIKITDNGKGIAPDDMDMAFERHATSKIRKASDLSTVTSMGFRGEALASIAAISKVEMVSKTASQETGCKVVVEAGNIIEKEEVGCQTGTSITVNNLFFNTPVRYKFLKKDYTESGYIEDVVTRIALVNPKISIRLINTGKTVIQTTGNGDLKSVIYSIYGKEIASSVAQLDYYYQDIEVIGVVGKPEIARSNRSNQLFFVNQRHIKDKTLTAATEQAYKGLIPIGKFGFVVLNLKMNPAKVDVNVHPAKLEVRFEEENKVFQAIYHAIKDTLLKSELVANPEKAAQMQRTNRENTFEERLKMIQEAKKETKEGLFGFRKQKEKEIEKYTQEESNLKTNNIIEQIYEENKEGGQESKTGQEKATTSFNVGKPMDTQDILLQLKQMKTKLEQELKPENNGVKEESENYSYQDNQDLKSKQINSKETEIQESEETQEDFKKEIGIITKSEQEQENNENLVAVVSQEPETVETSAIWEPKREEKKAKVVTGQEKEEELCKKQEQLQKTKKVLGTLEKMQNEEVTPKDIQEVKETMEELRETTMAAEENQDFNEMYIKLFGTKPASEREKEKEEAQKVSAVDLVKSNVSFFENSEKEKVPTYKFIGIVFKTYIILEIEKEMYILDQHAAHERIMYEKVKKNYYSDEQKDSQLLLLPDIITLTHKEMNIAKENMEMFRQAGFSLEEFGENTIKLTGVPTVCIDIDNKELFLETLDEIDTVARTAKQEKEEKFIATVACKSAVKANMALTEQEVHSLMDKLLKLPNPFTCPHGRPTVIKMTKYDIERKFARK